MSLAEDDQALAKLQPMTAEAVNLRAAIAFLTFIFRQRNGEDEFPEKVIVPVYYGVSERMGRERWQTP